MKKWITCFFTVCLLAVALSVTALAAGTVADVTPGKARLTNEGDRVGVTYDDAQAGKEYLVLATDKEVTPATLKAEDIVYINQETAGENGSVGFTIIPSKLASKTYYVYMSSNADSGSGSLTVLEQVGAYVGEGPAFKRGDVNDDGKVNTMDALMAINHFVGKRELTGTAFLAADVAGGAGNRGDDKVNTMDALKMINCFVGKITEDEI